MVLPAELHGKMCQILGDAPNVKFLKQKKVYSNEWMISQKSAIYFIIDLFIDLFYAANIWREMI